MRKDGQMDMTQLIVDFRNFESAPENRLANIAAIYSLSCGWGVGLTPPPSSSAEGPRKE